MIPQKKPVKKTKIRVRRFVGKADDFRVVKPAAPAKPTNVPRSS